MAEKKEKIEKKTEEAEVEREEEKALAIEKEKKKDKRKEKKTEKAEKRERRLEGVGIAHIYASYNNTIVHITDLAGTTVARVSGGQQTKHDRLKANPTVAMFVAKRAAEQAKEQGITSLYVRISSKSSPLAASGPGSHAAIKSLSREGMRILNISDVVPVPRGGPKAKGGKRGRRP